MKRFLLISGVIAAVIFLLAALNNLVFRPLFHLKAHYLGHVRVPGLDHSFSEIGEYFALVHFSLFSFLLPFGLIVLGWWTLKKANGTAVKKWTGFFLIAAGICSILPKIIVIPLIIAGLYVTWKHNKKTKTLYYEGTSLSRYSSRTASKDILDEWEQRTYKEEKDNGNF